MKIATFERLTHMEEGKLTLVEAVETLSNIADMNIDPAITLFKDQGLMITPSDSLREIDWQKGEGLEVVKGLFSVVLDYLRGFYKDHYTSIKDAKTLEGIKTIMVLVGEAAKKIDKFQAEHFREKFKSITDTEEYKRLQEFYKKKISSTIDEGTLGKWLYAITRQSLERNKKLEKKSINEHLFIDLDTVKKDSDYELLVIRKENGSRFFNPRVIRNIKLVSDFGHFFSRDTENNPLSQIHYWQDFFAQDYAEHFLNRIIPHINRFYAHFRLYKESELAFLINKSFMALMLAADKHNVKKNIVVKSSADYFSDAVDFLKKAINDREFQRMHLYGVENEHSKILVSVIFNVAKALFEPEYNQSCIQPFIKELTKGKSNPYQVIKQALRNHPGGPLSKAIELLEDNPSSYFEPLSGLNVPTKSYELNFDHRIIDLIRCPCPVLQESIEKATLSPAFQVIVDSSPDNLVINWQDPLHVRQEARCSSLRNLKTPVICIPIESDLFRQEGEYREENKADVFKKHISHDLSKLAFKLPLTKWIDEIHKTLFESKKELSREERIVFLEFVVIFIELKAIEHYKAKKVYFICKDGLDVVPAHLSCLAHFYNLFKGSPTPNLETLLGFPLLVRERTLLDQSYKKVDAFKTFCDEYKKHSAASENLNRLITTCLGSDLAKSILKDPICPDIDYRASA